MMPWAPDYIEAEDLADYVRTDVESDRVELALACTAASRAIDLATYRQFGSTASEARIFTPKWSTKRGMWVVECDDIFAAPSAIAVDTAGDGTFSTTVDVSAAVLLPVNNGAEGKPYERVALRRGVSVFNPLGYESVRFTAAWGWTAGIPETIFLAARLQASRFFARRNSPYGIAGSPDQGSEIRLQARADPDVALSVRYYKRAVWLS
jgi:hypothetical protein